MCRAIACKTVGEIAPAGRRRQTLGGKNHMRGDAETADRPRPSPCRRRARRGCCAAAPLRRSGARIAGSRLSASTRSAAAASASGSRGVTAAIRLSRYVTMVRSPRASMKIADSAGRQPVDPLTARWCRSLSRASAAKTRSPLSSLPAGPPSGPASTARPPSRAIATAALAAQPPLTMKNSSASTLPSLPRKFVDAEHLVEHDDAGAQDARRVPRPWRHGISGSERSRPCSTKSRMMWCAMAIGGGVVRLLRMRPRTAST